MKAVIVGAGRIATGFDNPGDRMILTHAHAFSESPDIQLVGVFDIDPDRAKEAALKWSTQAYIDFDRMMAECKPSVVSVCTPDKTHGEYLERVASYAPRLVLAEKPLTTDIGESRQLLDLYRRSGILCNVDYSRRFDPYLWKVHNDFLSGKLGKAVAAQAVYGKGLNHNGSHLVDFFRWFFGEVTDYSVRDGLIDASPDDPSISFNLVCQNCPEITVSCVDSRMYTVFEIVIFFENMKLNLLLGGLKAVETWAGDDPLYAGYRDLVTVKNARPGLGRAMKYYVNDSLAAIKEGHSLGCPIEDVVRTQELCSEITAVWRKKNG